MEFDLVSTDRIEIRRDGDGNPTTLSGYAAVFHVPGDGRTEYRMNVGGRQIVERFSRGAFANVLAKNPDVVAVLDHEISSREIIGRTGSGTLRLWEDATGLGYEVQLPQRSSVRDMVEQVERRDISGSSLGFLPADGGERFEKEGKVEVRWIDEVGRLRDVGPTGFPAYEGTSVSVRALLDAVDAETEATKARADERRAAERRLLLDRILG